MKTQIIESMLSYSNGFEKTECVGKKLKNIAPNVLRLGEVAEHKTSIELQMFKLKIECQKKN